jgi:hypothetical protein
MAATLIAGMMQHKRAGDQSEATSLKDLEDPMPDMSEHIHAGVLHKCPFYAGPGTTIASWRQVSECLSSLDSQNLRIDLE